MKNAVFCDLRTLAPFMPSIVVTLIFTSAFLMIGSGAVGAATSVSVMMTLLCAFSLAGYEDQNNWGRFRAALPLPRREVVAGRYVTVLILAFAGVLLSVALSLTLQNLLAALPQAESPEPAELAEVCGSSLASMACGLIVCAIAIPFLTKFGGARGARAFACVTAIMAAIVIAAGLNLVAPEKAAEMAGWIDQNPVVSLALLGMISLLAYGASYAVSLGIYEKKDL